MAFSLSTKSITPSRSISRLFALRFRSSLPNHTDLSDGSDPLLRKLEDALHRITVRRAAPDWLPFIPGSSYWVRPPISLHPDGIARLIDSLANRLTDEQTLSTTTIRGWPSSDYFVKGLPLHPLNTKASSVKSEPKVSLKKSEATTTSNNVSVSDDEEG